MGGVARDDPVAQAVVTSAGFSRRVERLILGLEVVSVTRSPGWVAALVGTSSLSMRARPAGLTFAPSEFPVWRQVIVVTRSQRGTVASLVDVARVLSIADTLARG